MALRIRVIAAAIVPFALAFASPAQAQSLGRLLACQDIARAEERLACYDAAARNAVGLGAPVQRAPESDLAKRAADLDAREARLAEREAQIKKIEASLAGRQAKTTVAQSEALAPATEIAGREAALAQREAELKAREAKLAALPTAQAEEEATLFGIPIPFTRKDAFNQQTDTNGVKIERNSDGNVDAIMAAVREWSLTGDGMMIVVLENGQVWRQTDGAPLRLRDDPANPNIARISRAALGSFMMTVNGSAKSIKVRRVDGKKPKS